MKDPMGKGHEKKPDWDALKGVLKDVKKNSVKLQHAAFLQQRKEKPNQKTFGTLSFKKSTKKMPKEVDKDLWEK